MREYRIFNKKLGSYMSVQQSGFLAQDPDSPNNWIALGELVENQDFVIEQFTGLFDKNEKKIFEGDLAKLYNTNNSRYSAVNTLSAEPDIVLINYIAPKFVFTYPTARYKFIEEMSSDSSIIEIFGNISQNKL